MQKQKRIAKIFLIKSKSEKFLVLGFLQFTSIDKRDRILSTQGCGKRVIVVIGKYATEFLKNVDEVMK